jgi:hypothetical protein
MDRRRVQNPEHCLTNTYPCTRLGRVSVLDSMPVKRSLSQSDHNSITTVTLGSLSTPIGCLNVSGLHAWSYKYPAHIKASATTVEDLYVLLRVAYCSAYSVGLVAVGR